MYTFRIQRTRPMEVIGGGGGEKIESSISLYKTSESGQGKHAESGLCSTSLQWSTRRRQYYTYGYMIILLNHSRFIRILNYSIRSWRRDIQYLLFIILKGVVILLCNITCIGLPRVIYIRRVSVIIIIPT